MGRTAGQLPAIAQSSRLRPEPRGLKTKPFSAEVHEVHRVGRLLCELLSENRCRARTWPRRSRKLVRSFAGHCRCPPSGAASRLKHRTPAPREHSRNTCVWIAQARHAGLDPASMNTVVHRFDRRVRGPRIKSGVTMRGGGVGWARRAGYWPSLPAFTLSRFPRERGFSYISSRLDRRSASSSEISASISSSSWPSRISGRRWRVRLIRWSVTLPCGKL